MKTHGHATKATKLIRYLFECSILDYHHYCLLKALDEDFVYLYFEI